MRLLLGKILAVILMASWGMFLMHIQKMIPSEDMIPFLCAAVLASYLIAILLTRFICAFLNLLDVLGGSGFKNSLVWLVVSASLRLADLLYDCGLERLGKRVEDFGAELGIKRITEMYKDD